MLHFYTPWKRQKTRGILMFSWGIEIDHINFGNGQTSNAFWVAWVTLFKILHKIFWKKISLNGFLWKIELILCFYEFQKLFKHHEAKAY